MCTNQNPDAKGWRFAIRETMQLQDYTRMIVTVCAIFAARRKVIRQDIFETPYATH